MSVSLSLLTCIMRGEEGDFCGGALGDYASRLEGRVLVKAGTEFEWKMTNTILMTTGVGDQEKAITMSICK